MTSCAQVETSQSSQLQLSCFEMGMLGWGSSSYASNASNVVIPLCNLQSICVLQTLLRLQPRFPSLSAAPLSPYPRKAAGLMYRLLCTEQQPSCSEHRIVSWTMASLAELQEQKKYSLHGAVDLPIKGKWKQLSRLRQNSIIKCKKQEILLDHK